MHLSLWLIWKYGLRTWLLSLVFIESDEFSTRVKPLQELLKCRTRGQAAVNGQMKRKGHIQEPIS